MSYNHTPHLTPLEVCERLIGSLDAIGRAAGVKSKAPYHWRRASAGRAAGDIPINRARALLTWCGQRGIPLTAEHLIYGATEAEVARLQMRLSASRLPANGAGSLPGVAAQ